MRDPLGVSISYPMRPNGRGGLALSVGVDAVEDSLIAIIESLKGSHLLEPWLGWPIKVFSSIGDLAAIAEVIKTALLEAEDRIDNQLLTVTVSIGDDGFMPVTIVYACNGDFTVRTLQTGFRVLI